MKEIFKKNNLLFIYSFIMLFCFILGIIFISVIGDNGKTLIIESVSNYFNNIYIGDYKVFFSDLVFAIFINLIIFISGFSIIGIIFILLIICIKCFLLGFRLVSIIYTYKYKGIILGLIYISPNVIEIITLFYIGFLAITFSIILIRFLFFKKDFNKNIIIKRYFKRYLFSNIILVLASVLKYFVVPYILKLFNF